MIETLGDFNRLNLEERQEYIKRHPFNWGAIRNGFTPGVSPVFNQDEKTKERAIFLSSILKT